jgi:hypothetical protein
MSFKLVSPRLLARFARAAEDVAIIYELGLVGLYAGLSKLVRRRGLISLVVGGRLPAPRADRHGRRQGRLAAAGGALGRPVHRQQPTGQGGFPAQDTSRYGAQSGMAAAVVNASRIGSHLGDGPSALTAGRRNSCSTSLASARRRARSLR